MELPKGEQNERDLEELEFFLKTYLTHIVNSKDLKFSPELEDFLSKPDEEFSKLKEVRFL